MEGDSRPHSSQGLDEAERQAIDRCRAGRIEGLGALYDLYSQKVFRTCLRILGDQGEAEDATQEMFVRVFEQIHRFRGRSQFSTWLYRLTVNQSLNRLRAKQRHRRRIGPLSLLTDPAGKEDLPDRALIRQERSDQVQRLLDELSAEHRAIIVLREMEDLSYQQISDILEVPVGTVMSRLHRARQRLKSLWGAVEHQGIALSAPVSNTNEKEREP